MMFSNRPMRTELVDIITIDWIDSEGKRRESGFVSKDSASLFKSHIENQNGEVKNIETQTMTRDQWILRERKRA